MRLCIYLRIRRKLLIVVILFPITACILFALHLSLIKVNKPLEFVENSLSLKRGFAKYNVVASSKRVGQRDIRIRKHELWFHSTDVLPTVENKSLAGKNEPTKQFSDTAERPKEKRTTSATFVLWQKNKATACDGNLEMFSGHFVALRDVIFDKKFVWSDNLGGENLSKVMSQLEDAEYYNVNKGFFKLECRDFPPQYLFPSSHNTHLNTWFDNTTPLTNKSVISTPVTYVKDFTIIVKRYEYVNLYHSMTDFYNAFLIMKFFQNTPHDTKILLFDSHPKGSLDPVWAKIFNSYSRVSQLGAFSQYRHAVWNIPGYDSPMYDYSNPERIPLIEEFRQFFLKQYGVLGKSALGCKRLKLVIIWRRNYVAHARNPKGRIERKIWNEVELLRVAEKTGFFSFVIGIQLEKLSMKSQLSIVSNADVLVGMHGAGLTHTLFLPSHAGLIELVPEYFSPLGHFEGLARWRGLHYLRWINEDVSNEKSGKRTRIPPSVFRKTLFDMKQKICGGKLGIFTPLP